MSFKQLRCIFSVDPLPFFHWPFHFLLYVLPKKCLVLFACLLLLPTIRLRYLLGSRRKFPCSRWNSSWFWSDEGGFGIRRGWRASARKRGGVSLKTWPTR